jgi:hypothetical protein
VLLLLFVACLPTCPANSSSDCDDYGPDRACEVLEGPFFDACPSGIEVVHCVSPDPSIVPSPYVDHQGSLIVHPPTGGLGTWTDCQEETCARELFDLVDDCEEQALTAQR